MTCESFDARLDALLDGRCTPDEWSEAESHLAVCPRCSRLFEAMSGRADDLDAEGHQALASGVLARTSGAGSCASARERICDFVDRSLDDFDHALVQGHLAHCAECSALADAVTEQTRLLAMFASLPPRESLVRGVLDITSRKPVQPNVADRLGALVARAAQRPRFSLEVAYVLTVLMLVVLGNPVDAFREASVRVQPRVSAVSGAVGRPLNEIRAAGAEKLAHVELALAPKFVKPYMTDTIETLLRQWIVEPAQSIAARLNEWNGALLDAVRRVLGGTPTEPPAPRAR